MTASERAQSLVDIATRAVRVRGGEDVVAIDVSSRLPLTDAFLIVTATSERQVEAIADEAEDQLAAAGARPIRREGKNGERWLLVDAGEIVVHVFHEEERMYYDLERLWSDCPTLPIPQEDPVAAE